MRKILFRFLMFVAAFWALGEINLPTLVLGIVLMMSLTLAGHILATPDNY
ncbi:MAG TPA: hypothetical protein VK210_04175 [Terriglobia bacterium]|nr:hypothetical protein [Terriglobia bacterium]